MIKEANSNADMDKSGVFEFFQLLRESRERVQAKDCAGSPSTDYTT